MEAFNSLSRRGQLIRLGRLARMALGNYPLPVTRVAPLKHEHNSTFRVWTADGRKFVLRIHRPGQHTLEAIHSELLWLEALNRDTQLEVPRPVPAKEGELFTRVEVEDVPEPRVCVLFSWLEGRFIDEHLQPVHLEQVGSFTALLHEHASGWSPPTGFRRGRVDVLTAQARGLLWDLAETRSPDGFVKYPSDEDVDRCLRLISSVYPAEVVEAVDGVIQRIRRALIELGHASEKFGLIHADLHQENYFFHQGRARAIDFDDCGFGHYLFDLNVTLIEIQYLPRYDELRTAFLSGYRQVRSLPVEDEAYLDAFFALRHLQLLVWVLESRTHPAFRDSWEPWTQSLLKKLGESPLADQ
jgi:Ser/Thr protein kinase RdoA (MazF antagonist)